MDKIRITNHQLFALTANFTCGSAVMAASSSAASIAKQDAWLSMLFTLVLGLLEIGIVCFLVSYYPGKTYVEMLQKILGRKSGSAIAIGFVFFCMLSDAQITWYIGNFITTQVMFDTPVYAINIVFMSVIMIALFYGLEAIARSYEIFLYFISLLFFAAIFLVLPNARIEYLQPMFEKGLLPIIKGSFLLSSFLIFPIGIMLMIFPANTDNTSTAKQSFVKGYLWGGFIIFVSIFVSIIVLGSTIAANSQYPVYILAKEIQAGTVFSRLEFLVAAVWIITLLARGILYFYAALISLVQLLNLQDQQKIILPLGLVLTVLSEVVYTDVIHQADWDLLVWPPFAATFGVLLPLVMLIGCYFEKRGKCR